MAACTAVVNGGLTEEHDGRSSIGHIQILREVHGNALFPEQIHEGLHFLPVRVVAADGGVHFYFIGLIHGEMTSSSHFFWVNGAICLSKAFCFVSDMAACCDALMLDFGMVT